MKSISVCLLLAISVVVITCHDESKIRKDIVKKGGLWKPYKMQPETNDVDPHHKLDKILGHQGEQHWKSKKTLGHWGEQHWNDKYQQQKKHLLGHRGEQHWQKKNKKLMGHKNEQHWRKQQKKKLLGHPNEQHWKHHQKDAKLQDVTYETKHNMHQIPTYKPSNKWSKKTTKETGHRNTASPKLHRVKLNKDPLHLHAKLYTEKPKPSRFSPKPIKTPKWNYKKSQYKKKHGKHSKKERQLKKKF